VAAKYERVAEALRHEIRSGFYAPGDQLPTEAVLLERFRVSPGPVRQAIAVLRSEGLVESRHGVGTYVRAARPRVRRNHTERYQWEKDRVTLPEDERRRTGATEHDTGLPLSRLRFYSKYRDLAAPGELAARFGVPEGAPLLHREYRTGLIDEDSPLNQVDSYLPRELIESNPALFDVENEPWPGGTQHQLSTVGIELDRIEDEISARPPTAEEAEELNIPPGIAVLVVRKISTDVNDRVVEISDIVLPGDRTTIAHTTRLTRQRS
jgi:GntR family transcriptional regulator